MDQSERDKLLAELEALDGEIENVRRTAPNPTAVLELQTAILHGRRDAFAKELAEAVLTAPDAEAKAALAKKDPLAHAQYVKIYAGLSGVADRVELDITKQLSEVEMLDLIRKAGYTPPDTRFPHEIEATANDANPANDKADR